MENLFELFSAGSANDENNKHLWVIGASLFIKQINALVELAGYNMALVNITDFENDYSYALANIFMNNGSDKSYIHNYQILYSYILNQLGIENQLNVLEIGLGTNNPSLVSTMGVNGRPGASLYSWRDFLPNANIYGADIDKDILFNSARIETCYIDQLQYGTFDELQNKFGNIQYDLIIDDGLHSIAANFNTLLFAIQNIKKNGWIVIEDIHFIDNWKAIDYILKSTNLYKTFCIQSKSAFMYVVHKL